MRVLIRRLAYLFRRGRADRELVEELQFHREMLQRDFDRSGVTGDEAVRAVSRAMGNTVLVREDARLLWSYPRLESIWQDVRHGVRSLRRSPGLVIISTLSLGLGIGVNAVLYMGADTVYRHRPTMVDPDRMVGVEPGNANQFSYPDYQELVRSGIVADALGFRAIGMNLRSSDRIIPVSALAVTGNFFEVLGVRARLGRTFSALEAAAEREPRVVVMTHAFWQSYMRADPGVVGHTLTLNGEVFAVLGVLPEDYRAVTGWVGPGLYVPLSRFVMPALEERGSPSLSVMARLAPNAGAAETRLAVTALGASLERAYPERDQGMGQPASVFPAEAMQFRGTPARFFLIGGLLWASVVLVLVIASVNVTGLLMARAAHRRNEIAIRVALGAGRGRVVQAMLVESFLLVLSGATFGLLLGFALSRWPWPSAVGPLQDAIQLDGRLLRYALGLLAMTTLLCGLVPALKATRGDVMTEVRQGGNGMTSRLWLRHALVVGQVAMSLMLIVLALLCVRSQLYIGGADLGFDIDHGVVVRFGLDPTQYPLGERARFADRIVASLEQLPGVAAVSVADFVPLGGDSLLRSFHPAGRTDIPGTRPSVYSVGPGYFRSLAIAMVRGRDFDATQVAGTPAVVVVNETFARTYFPGRDVVGQRIQTAGEPDAEVIGMVADTRIGTIGEAPASVLYYPFAQRPGRLIVHVRTSASPEGMVPTIARVVERLDGMVPVSVQTLRGAASLELTMRRVGTVLMGSIGAVGLLLTMIGLYGVMAYVVASRNVEIAIRMALGASAGRVRRDVLEQVLALVAAGVAIGGAAALSLAPALRTFLVGVSPFDPVAFGAAALVLALVGLAAGLVPAIRGSRITPMRALRQL